MAWLLIYDVGEIIFSIERNLIRLILPAIVVPLPYMNACMRACMDEVIVFRIQYDYPGYISDLIQFRKIPKYGDYRTYNYNFQAEMR